MNTPLNQVSNPTDHMRHELLRNALEEEGRTEDFDYIVKLLSPPPDITNYALPGDLRGVKIGIIGGGLAGLSAAFELRKLGAEITVLEACERRIGGRVYTHYFDTGGKYYGEFGAARIPVSHETSWHYINLFHLNTQAMSSPKRNNFLYVHNTRLRVTDSIEQYLYPKYNLTPQERNTPFEELSHYAMTHRYRSLSPEQRSQLLQILPEYSPEFEPLMEISLRQNFETLGLSQDAINLLTAVDQSIGSLLYNSYDELAQEDYSMDLRNAYRIEGGNIHLPLAFYETFREDYPKQYSDIDPASLGTVTYRSGQLVTGIYQSDYRNKIVVKYSCKSERSDTADIFDYVICAIPLTTLRNIEIKPFFSNMKTQAILEYNYIDVQKTLFLCNRRFWERNTDYGSILGGISQTDLPIQSILYPSDHNQCAFLSMNPSCPEEPGVLVASYSIGQNAVRLGALRDPRRYELIRQNLEEVHGLPRGFLNSLVLKCQMVHWNAEPNFLGALSCTLPGQKSLFTYELTRPEFNGRLYLAGEHVSNKHGWMQGALYSGKETANKLAKHFHEQYY